jgi:hypothetical protein
MGYHADLTGFLHRQLNRIYMSAYTRVPESAGECRIAPISILPLRSTT